MTNMSYDGQPPTPKNVNQTKMLDTTAREPKSTQAGDNKLVRFTGKHKPFGPGGARGWATSK